jgi:hypothetical protein
VTPASRANWRRDAAILFLFPTNPLWAKVAILLGGIADWLWAVRAGERRASMSAANRQ